MRDLVIVRTHTADAAALAAFDRYAALPDLDVVFGCDELSAPVDTQGRAKVSLDQRTLLELRLFAHPRAGWLCGDYVYYAVRQAHPDHLRYWLIEPDVVIHAADLGAFFAGFRDNAADMLGVRLSPKDPSWNWYSTMAGRYPEVHGCVFPITRLSARAIDHLLGARQRDSIGMDLTQRFAWPNDEAFVATELANNGFTCADFNDSGRTLHTLKSFRNGSIHPAEALATRPHDGMIWHPVRSVEPWLQSLEEAIGQLAFVEGDALAVNLDRPDAWRFATAGRTLGENPPTRMASLVPLLVGLNGFTHRHWNRIRPALAERNAAMDERRLLEVEDLLVKRFPRRDQPPETRMTAHLAEVDAAVKRSNIAKTVDFRLDEGVPIGLFPRGFALPYTFDRPGRALLCTAHVQPAQVIQRGPLSGAQRAFAKVMVRVPWRALNAALGRPDPEAAPIFVLASGQTGNHLLDALIDSVTARRVFDPDSVTHIALHRNAYRRLDPALLERIVFHSVSAFLGMSLPPGRDRGCVIRLRPEASAALPDLIRVFPRARFVLVERDRHALALAAFRSFRTAAALTAQRIAEVEQAASVLREAQVDSAILAHDEIHAAPRAALEVIFGTAIQSLSPEELDEAAAAAVVTAARESAAVGPGRVAPSRAEEEAWLLDFDASWPAAAALAIEALAPSSLAALPAAEPAPAAAEPAPPTAEPAPVAAARSPDAPAPRASKSKPAAPAAAKTTSRKRSSPRTSQR